jgi:intermembrane space import and assembly protein 40
VAQHPPPHRRSAAGAQQQLDDGARQQQEQAIKSALDCPCVSDLKGGPCGAPFVLAFSCFHRSTADPRGCDCLQENLAFAVSGCQQAAGGCC